MTQASTSNIVMYTHPDCPFSAAAKMDYRRNKISYTEIDLGKEPDKIPDLTSLTNGERITPVIVANGEVTIGFKGQY